MKRGATRAKVLAFVRDRMEATGEQPTCNEGAAAVGISGVMFWKHIQTLIGERKLIDLGSGKYDLPGRDDLSGIGTEQLRSELARRGETMDALDQPVLMHQANGRPCAAHGCMTRVQRGMLMCRPHWFKLPPRLRSAIMNAWGARHLQAYQEGVEAARDYLGGFTKVVERVE